MHYIILILVFIVVIPFSLFPPLTLYAIASIPATLPSTVQVISSSVELSVPLHSNLQSLLGEPVYVYACIDKKCPSYLILFSPVVGGIVVGCVVADVVVGGACVAI